VANVISSVSAHAGQILPARKAGLPSASKLPGLGHDPQDLAVVVRE